MTPLRLKKLALADSRAVEEQKERMEDVQGMPQKALPIAGGKKKAKAEKKEAVECAYDEGEVEGYGRSLAQHISGLHGGGYMKSFMKGMSAYGNPAVSAVPVAFDNNVVQKEKKMKGGMKRMVGAGPLQVSIAHKSDSEEEMEGGAQTGRLEGEGKVDSRKARAAVVKKVMAEKGLSMAQASKYVKEHNLYKK